MTSVCEMNKPKCFILRYPEFVPLVSVKTWFSHSFSSLSSVLPIACEFLFEQHTAHTPTHTESGLKFESFKWKECFHECDDCIKDNCE